MTAPSGERRFVLTVSPLPGRLGFTHHVPGIMVMINTPDATNGPDGEYLAGRYGLTIAEVGIALALARGQSPGGIAASRNVRITTIRTQIRRLIEKTGSQDLRDLVRRLVSPLPRD